MKNDFREFYDEDYIMHSMTEEEYLMHASGWGKKFIDKIRTKFGKWRYIYPEDLKTLGNAAKDAAGKAKQQLKWAGENAAQRTKEAVDYLKSNKKFAKTASKRKTENRVRRTSGLPNYERIQRQARTGLAESQRRDRQLNAAKANQMYYDKTAQRHAKKAETMRRATQLHAANANKKYYDKGSSDYRNEVLTNKAKAHASALKAAQERRERQLRAANANKQYYDQSYVKAKSLEKNKERNSRRLSKKRKNPVTVLRNVSSKKRG